MPFGRTPKPAVAATSRACRAVVTVRQSTPELELAMFRALQRIQFTTPLPLDEDETLRAAATTVPGVEADDVPARLDSPEVWDAYDAGRGWGAVAGRRLAVRRTAARRRAAARGAYIARTSTTTASTARPAKNMPTTSGFWVAQKPGSARSRLWWPSGGVPVQSSSSSRFVGMREP